MTRKEYCESSDVQEFIRWISYLMDKENSFTHTYIIAKTNERWKCNSIYAAFINYKWSFHCNDSKGNIIKGNSFLDSKKILDECSDKLRTSLYTNNDEACFLACKQILEWGGVTNKNVDRISSMENCCDYFKYAIKALEIDNDLEGYINTDIIMNSGFTKIYSLIIDDFIIYDSRVGAALGLLVKCFCEETNREKIPEELLFAWGIKRMTLCGQTAENPRNPSNHIYNFPLISSSKIHIMNNIRANWLLKEILNKTNSKFNCLAEGMALRALEAALFMIGYEVRDFDYENIKRQNENTQNKMTDISIIIKEKLEKNNGKAEISLLKANNSFYIELADGGILVDNLKNEPYLEWKVFEKTIELLEQEGGNALKGNAMNNKLGEKGLPYNSIEGYIAKEVYGKKTGDSVFRRITPIVNILIWAGVCENARGKLVLK